MSCGGEDHTKRRMTPQPHSDFQAHLKAKCFFCVLCNSWKEINHSNINRLAVWEFKRIISLGASLVTRALKCVSGGVFLCVFLIFSVRNYWI